MVVNETFHGIWAVRGSAVHTSGLYTLGHVLDRGPRGEHALTQQAKTLRVEDASREVIKICFLADISHCEHKTGRPRFGIVDAE